MNSTTIHSTEDELSPTQPQRLLLVEDNDTLRLVLKEVLQGWSFVPAAVATVSQAQHTVLTSAPFAAVVSDYDLPDGTGLEFLAWLRRNTPTHVPFLLISGGVPRLPSAEDDYEFLAKPFPMEDFHRRLDGLISDDRLVADPYHVTPAQEAAASVYARYRPAKAA